MEMVVSAVISRKDGDKNEYLLVSSVLDYGEYTGFFYPPTGHVLNTETERDTLVQKIKHELSITIQPIKRYTITMADLPDQIISWWDCHIEKGSVIPNKNRVSDIVWRTKADIISAKDVWPATKKFFENFIT